MTGPEHYRKKPVEIEAWQFTDTGEGIDLARWCGGDYFPAAPGGITPVIYIHTMEGTMEARRDDWVICGIQGEFYPCKPDIFEATYEPAPDGAS